MKKAKGKSKKARGEKKKSLAIAQFEKQLVYWNKLADAEIAKPDGSAQLIERYLKNAKACADSLAPFTDPKLSSTEANVTTERRGVIRVGMPKFKDAEEWLAFYTSPAQVFGEALRSDEIAKEREKRAEGMMTVVTPSSDKLN